MKDSAVFTQPFDIQSHHIDQNFEITLHYLLGCMQQAADMHVDQCHIGWNDMNAKGCFWAIYRMGLRIVRMPRKYDTILVSTWANPPQNLIQPRSFKVTDQNGQTIAYAQSLWVILDNQNFNLQKVEDVVGQDIPYLMGENEPYKIPLKIGPINTKDLEPAAIRNVLYSDIDTNRHVNNANYPRWLIDSYSADFLQSHRISEIVINYTKQARLGDKYAVFIHQKSDNEHFAIIEDAVSHEEICKLKAGWQAR